MKCTRCGTVENVLIRFVDKDGKPNQQARQWPVYREEICDDCWKKEQEKQWMEPRNEH